MKNYDIVILTDRRYINPKEINDYNRNVLLEDKLVQDALEKYGLKVTRLSWDDTEFDWSTTSFILFRTTWDYFDRFDEFSSWLNRVGEQTNMINSENTIRWNIDKRYFKDLEVKGVHCAPTLFVEKGNQKSLLQLHEENSYAETVLKPVFSGGARHTYKLNHENISAHEDIFTELTANEPMMLQPFQHKIVTEGEKSLMLMGGEYTHAVLKIAKQGDFRVQDDFGGSVYEYHPTKEEILFAQMAVQACEELPLYARVDIFNDNDGNISLAELELIEPELWFRNYPKAAQILAKSIDKYIHNQK